MINCVTKLIDEDLIYLLYYDMEFSTRKIAEILHIGKTTILSRMKKNGWKRRTDSESKNISFSKKNITRLITNKDWLVEQYWMQGKSAVDIAEEQNETIYAVYYYMKKFDINTRDKKETELGEKNHMFGKKLTEQTKKKISESLKGNLSSDIDYYTLHSWIKKHKLPSLFCEECGSIDKKLELSCINHKYIRDIDQFRWLCRYCHKKYDLELKIGE